MVLVVHLAWNYNNEKEAFPIQIQEIKTLYQCNTLKNFYKPKNIQKLLDAPPNEYEANKLQTSLKQIYELSNQKNNNINNKKSLSIRHSSNDPSQKNTYINNSNKNYNLSNNNSLTNVKKSDNNKSFYL